MKRCIDRFLLLPAALAAWSPCAEGQTPVWSRRWGGEAFEQLEAMALDARQYSYSVGKFRGALPLNAASAGSPLPDTLRSAGGYDALLIRYDAAGRLRGAWRWGSAGRDEAWAVAADGQGSIYLAGTFHGKVDFAPGPRQVHKEAQGRSAFLLKLDTAGQFRWVRTFPGLPQALLADSARIVLAGGFEGRCRLPAHRDGAPQRRLRSAGDEDAYVLAFRPDGRRMWARRLGGAGQDRFTALARGPDQALYLTGFVRDSVAWGAKGRPLRLTHAGAQDGLVLALGPGGAYRWARRWGSAEWDAGKAVLAGRSGQCYVAGQLDFRADGQSRAVILRLDSAGQHLQQKPLFRPTHMQMATALTPAGAGGVYVGGQSSVPASQAQVSFVARLTAGLKPNGLAILTGTAKHQVAALAALPGADLLIGGNFREAYAPQPTPMQGLFGRRPDVLEERQDTGAAIERIEAAGHDDGYLTRWHWPE